VQVRDNGMGMSSSVLRLALQFGGSTKFNSRTGMGRYGMGLPNSSLSQSKRVDVYTWTNQNKIWGNHLDIDQIISEGLSSVPKSKKYPPDKLNLSINSKSGTIVVWSKCDRLDHKSAKILIEKLHSSLGKIFREYLWNGKVIRINGINVRPIDPLFYREGNNLTGAKLYGTPIKYEVKIPGVDKIRKTSTVTVTFSELPVNNWHEFSNEEKRAYGITKKAGVSIVRAGREIDHGWYFMGSKRKENYDDWWRCEVKFNPDLDELFGVTHTKQGIHPTETIASVLTLDMEKIAHKLNSRVREKYIRVKQDESHLVSQSLAKRRDVLLEPPVEIRLESQHPQILKQLPMLNNKETSLEQNLKIQGLIYKLEHKILQDPCFFIPIYFQNELSVILNEQHPFFEKVYTPVVNSTHIPSKVFRQNIELLLFAVARAESCVVAGDLEKSLLHNLRKFWSNTLATFLT
jgi:Histidine kinase-, DNA gyrase B-, and HSP90-like ATPase